MAAVMRHERIPERRSGLLIYCCPKTDKVVRTSINATEDDVRRMQALKFSLWCPHCQVGHAILGKDTQVVSDVISSAA